MSGPPLVFAVKAPRDSASKLFALFSMPRLRPRKKSALPTGQTHVSEPANRRNDLGEAARILGEKAGWHFQAARASLGDISTESTVLPWSG